MNVALGLLRRAAAGAFVVLSVFVLSFMLIHLAPGSPGGSLKQLPPEVQRNLEGRMGVGGPLAPALLRTAGSYLKGDLGVSLVSGGREPVSALLARTFPVSLQLGLVALAIALLLGISGGLMAGARAGKPPDRLVSGAALIAVSLSALGLGTLLRWLLIQSGWFGIGGWDEPLDLLLPALVLGLVYGAWLALLVRSTAARAMRSNWVLAARSRGVRGLPLLVRHVLPEALVPLLGYLGPLVANLLTGSFVVEVLFEVPGMSRSFMTAASARDYPVLMAIVLLYTVLLTFLNLVFEALHLAADPRLRSGEALR